uniref:Phosphoglycerate mutase (2,3-diphosphoglycerate-dependent) n=1 Tax=Araucaria cunninghamii TaxID=56994 RepID=A0A0D6R9J4_ARACU
MAMALKNKYWVLRHGRSIPNEKGLIVSSLENGVLPEYGLATDGIRQANAAGELFLKEITMENISIEKVRIYFSPFSRTRQTAEAVASVLNLPFDGPQMKAMEELRERYFGPQLELQSHNHYPEIWALDEKDPFTPPEGGESVADVACRLATIMPKIEAECEGYGVLIVAHGDPLQIFQTILHATIHKHSSEKNGILEGNSDAVMTASTLSQHRTFSLLTGELRRVI